MISHVEKPILLRELSRIYASSRMMKSEQSLVHSIIQQINKNKNGIELDQNDRNTLIGILNEHMDLAGPH